MEEKNTKSNNILSESRKITIINVALLTLVGTNFRAKIDKINSWGENEEEKAFTQQVFTEIRERTSKGNIDARFRQQLKSDLYDKFGISKEEQEREEKSRKEVGETIKNDLKRKREEWIEQDRQDAQKIEGKRQERQTSQTINKNLTSYKRSLYNPQLIGSRNTVKGNMPVVKLDKIRQEEIVDYQYEFKGIEYIIRRTGELVYKTSIGLEDSVEEYQITMKKGNRSATMRKFGQIIIPNMHNALYRQEVFQTLLGKDNITDPELHSYMGSLEEVDGIVAEIQPYKIVHSSEQYTAVMILEELEKQQTKVSNLKEGISTQEGSAR